MEDTEDAAEDGDDGADGADFLGGTTGSRYGSCSGIAYFFLESSLSDAEKSDEEEDEEDCEEEDESDEDFEDSERRACVEFGSSLFTRSSLEESS